jgi:hypothetical protein
MRTISIPVIGKDRGYANGLIIGAFCESIESHAKNTLKKDLEEIIVCTLNNTYMDYENIYRNLEQKSDVLRPKPQSV